MLEDPENSAWSDNSVEFCGGTHLSNTQEAETFVILEEVAVLVLVRNVFRGVVDIPDWSISWFTACITLPES